MKSRKSIIYLLLLVLGIILIYNYFLAPSLMHNNVQMGMGMHEQINVNYNYSVDFRYILLIIIVIAGFVLFELIKPQLKNNVCSKCGNKIENDSWKVCPICGTHLKNRKVVDS